MSSSLEGLLRILHEMDELHTKLLELAEHKKHALVGNDVEQLSGIVNQENKLIKQIAVLNDERIECIGQLMIEKGFKPNPRVTISDIAKIVYQMEDKKRLMDAQKKLVATIRRLKTANQLNNQMIQHSLAFINYSVDLLIGDPEDGPVYRRPTEMQGGKKAPGLFDAKV